MTPKLKFSCNLPIKLLQVMRSCTPLAWSLHQIYPLRYVNTSHLNDNLLVLRTYTPQHWSHLCHLNIYRSTPVLVRCQTEILAESHNCIILLYNLSYTRLYIQIIQNVNDDNIKPEQSNLFIKDPSTAVLNLSISHNHSFFADHMVGVSAMSVKDLQVRAFLYWIFLLKVSVILAVRTKDCLFK